MSELRGWLDKLGGMSVAGIRKLLQDEGITGEIGNPLTCPIANFLAAKVGSHMIGHCSIAVGSMTVFDVDKILTMPDSVGTFIRCFDSGAFPELIA